MNFALIGLGRVGRVHAVLIPLTFRWDAEG